MAAGLPRGRGLSRRLTGAEGRRAAGLTARTAALLLDSGQSTHAAVATVERLNELLGTRLTLLPTWSQVTLIDADGAVAVVQAIRRVEVHMGRVPLIQRRLSATGSLSLDELEDLLEEVRTQPSSPTWMFALAAGLSANLIIGGTDLPLTATTDAIPLWLDVLATVGTSCAYRCRKPPRTRGLHQSARRCPRR